MSDKDFKVKHGLAVTDSIGVGTDAPAVSLDLSQKIDAIHLPTGNTSSRPIGANGMFRYNSTIGEFEGFASGAWNTLTLAGSSVDADFLDSQLPSYYLDLANATGNLPAGHFTNTSHGALGNGNLHLVANTTVNGFMSATDKVLLDAVPAGANTYIARGTLLTSDLNTITTSGWYYQDTGANGSLANHYPVANSAGLLEVFTHGVFTYQKFHFYGGSNQGPVYWRAYYNGSWYAWRTMFDSINLTQSSLNTLLGNANTIIVGTGALNSGTISNGFGNVDIGTSNFTGNGSLLTSLNATQLLSGTIPNARFPGTLPAANGANLTNLLTTALVGTIPDVNMPTWTRANCSAVDGSSDLNTLVTPGFYSQLVGPNNTNNAAAGRYFYLQVMQLQGTNTLQLAYPYISNSGTVGDNIYYRTRISAVWSAWSRVLSNNESQTVNFGGGVTGTTAAFTGNVSGTTGTFSGAVQSSQNFIAAGTAAVLATSSAGNIYLRPVGAGSTTGQAILTNGGLLTLVNGLVATTGTFSGAISGTTGTFSGDITTTGVDIGVWNQTTAPFRARVAGQSIEFGHTNPAGYGSALGSEVGSGIPYLAFCAEQGTTTNTYRTRGFVGSVISGDLAGGITFSKIATANADNQSRTSLATLSNAGLLALTGGLTATTGTFSGAVSGTTGTFTSTVTSAQIFQASGASVILSTTGAGTIYLSPNGAGSGTGRASLNNSGDLTVAGDVSANQNILSSTATTVLATTGAGAIYLRPNGTASATGQISLASTGATTINGSLLAGAISGTTGTFSGAVSGTTGTFTSTLATNGQFTITSANPYQLLKTTVTTGNSAISYIEWRDSGNAQLAYLGKVANNAVFTLSNLLVGSSWVFQGEGAATFATLSKATGLTISNVMNSGVHGISATAGAGTAAGVRGTTNGGAFNGYLGYNDTYAFYGSGPAHITGNVTTDMTFQPSNGTAANPSFIFNGDVTSGLSWTSSPQAAVVVSAAGIQSARFANNGMLVGSVTALVNPGAAIYGTSISNAGNLVVSADSGQSFIHKVKADGTIGSFYSGTTAQGSISVAGTTVTYSSFCGTHESQLSSGTKIDVMRGTILESIDEMAEWLAVEYTDNEGNIIRDEEMVETNHKVGQKVKVNYQKTLLIDDEYVTKSFKASGKVVALANDQLPKFKVSDTPKAKSVYGVFFAWDEDYKQTNDAKVASLGAFVIRIGKGIVVQKGDYIESAGDGTGRVQDDDILRSSTVAKVTSCKVVETFEDGSYLVPCTLHCG